MAAIVVGWVYRPVLGATAIWLDDQQYVTDNPLVLNPSWRAAGRFLSEVQHPSTVEGYYQPLTMISLMIDSATGGSADHLEAFHRTSLALHIINTVLMIVLLILLFDEPYTAAMIGVLFGLHPLTVEPVSWITERKTLLATCFALAALIAYVKYARARVPGSAGASRKEDRLIRVSSATSWFVATVACYALALLSKPTSTPLPILFVLLDFWPLGRLDRRAIREKLPLFVLGAVAIAITILSQQNTAIIEYPGEQSWSAIPLVVCYNVVFYLCKIIWPAHLLGFYLRPDYHSSVPMSVTNPLLMSGVVGTVMLVASTSVSLLWTRAILTSWLFYLVALFPTMGVLRVATVMVSEKYAYLPCLGPALVFAWVLGRCWSWGRRARRRGSLLQAGICVLTLALGAAEATVTRRYLTVWHDNDALYGYVHSHSPQAWFLQSDFGDMLAKKGDFAKAATHYLQAEADEEKAGVPPHAAIQQNLGNALMALGRTDEAVTHYRRALTLEPGDNGMINNLGVALVEIGKPDEAIAMFRRVLELDPTDAVANNGIGRALATKGDPQQALAHYRAAVQSNPDLVEAHVNLADTLQGIGQLDDSIAEYRIALRINPNSPNTHNNLAAALLEKGFVEEAIMHLRTALRLNPTDQDIQRNLQQALAQRHGSDSRDQ